MRPPIWGGIKSIQITVCQTFFGFDQLGIPRLDVVDVILDQEDVQIVQLGEEGLAQDAGEHHHEALLLAEDGDPDPDGGQDGGVLDADDPPPDDRNCLGQPLAEGGRDLSGVDDAVLLEGDVRRAVGAGAGGDADVARPELQRGLGPGDGHLVGPAFRIQVEGRLVRYVQVHAAPLQPPARLRRLGHLRLRPKGQEVLLPEPLQLQSAVAAEGVTRGANPLDSLPHGLNETDTSHETCSGLVFCGRPDMRLRQTAVWQNRLCLEFPPH
mmetsp:Transcript_81642/g.143975  ORF Transcript_81642/g.143975 Transcript_81642/m.143975 type:complete len:268 (+) Transcript_81642:962-1765(+)